MRIAQRQAGTALSGASRPLTARSKSRRRREETLAFFCFSKEMNESRDLDSYKIGFLNGLLTPLFRLCRLFRAHAFFVRFKPVQCGGYAGDLVAWPLADSVWLAGNAGEDRFHFPQLERLVVLLGFRDRGSVILF